MKILAVHNDHIEKKPERKYGCSCSKCGTVFVFERSEVTVPRCINPKPEYCTIMCPNCQNIMSLDMCNEFITIEDKEKFLQTIFYKQYIENK